MRTVRPLSLSKPAPTVRRSLGPFAVIFEELLFPAALQFGGKTTVRAWRKRFWGRLRREVKRHFGFGLHPAIVFYSLRLCCRIYWDAGRRASPGRKDTQRKFIDLAWGLIVQIEQTHYPLDYELLVLA